MEKLTSSNELDGGAGEDPGLPHRDILGKPHQQVG